MEKEIIDFLTENNEFFSKSQEISFEELTNCLKM